MLKETSLERSFLSISINFLWFPSISSQIILLKVRNSLSQSCHVKTEFSNGSIVNLLYNTWTQRHINWHPLRTRRLKLTAPWVFQLQVVLDIKDLKSNKLFKANSLYFNVTGAESWQNLMMRRSFVQLSSTSKRLIKILIFLKILRDTITHTNRYWMANVEQTNDVMVFIRCCSLAQNIWSHADLNRNFFLSKQLPDRLIRLFIQSSTEISFANKSKLKKITVNECSMPYSINACHEFKHFKDIAIISHFSAMQSNSKTFGSRLLVNMFVVSKFSFCWIACKISWAIKTL